MKDFQRVRDAQNLRCRRGPVRCRTTIAPSVVYAEGITCHPGNVIASPGLSARVFKTVIWATQ